jgi:hypothetical protein
MKFSYRLIRDKSGFVAECVESDAEGEGKTAKDAVESLRTSLEERMFRPDAVAPPPSPPAQQTIDLVLADDTTTTTANGGTGEERKLLDLGGPGDAPPPPVESAH